MKKKVKGLKINKKSISNFKYNDVKGGASDSPSYCQVCVSGTCGDCLRTWGDPLPGCITGIPYICEMI